MTITIGRADGLRIEEVRHSGDKSNFTGWVQAVDMDHARAYMQQINGLQRGDVVPVVDTESEYVTGFYEISSAKASLRKPIAASAFVDWTVSMERVDGGYASAAVEEVWTIFDPRTNGLGLTTFDSSWYYPAPESGWGWNNFNTQTEDTETGSLMAAKSLQSGGQSIASTFFIEAQNYYDSACIIEGQFGSTWYPIVGRQLPASLIVSKVRLSNGLIRITIDTTNDKIGVQRWNGTSYGDIHYFYYSYTRLGASVDVVPMVADATPIVVRNDPATVAIRFPQDGLDAATDVPPHMLSIGIVRGAFFATLAQEAMGRTGSYIDPQTSYLMHEDFDDVTTLAESINATYNPCIQSDANDTDGFRWFILGDDPFNTTVRTEGFFNNDAKNADYSTMINAIGVRNPTGSLPDMYHGWSAALVCEAFFCAPSASHRVVTL